MFGREIKNSLVQVLKELGIEAGDGEINLEHPDNLDHGDYSTNIAMLVSSKCNPSTLLRTSVQKPALSLPKGSKFKSPRELAEQIKTKWEELGLPDFVEKIEVAGAGFLNIWLNFDALGSELAELLKDKEKYGRGLKPAKTEENNVLADFPASLQSESLRQKTMVIDYSAPNIAKPFGIGHLRSTDIGQAIYNLYKFLGWKVIGDNHLGDWGTQFGKLIYQIINRKEKEQSVIPSPFDKLRVNSAEGSLSSEEKKGIPPLALLGRNDKLLEDLTIEDLEKLYVEFHKEAEEKPEMLEEARMWFKKLEEGDLQAKEIWQACVDISLKEFNRVYDLLGVKIDYGYGESFYLDKMQAVLADCREKGILKQSQGASVIELAEMDIPAMLVKSDGATTYLLRDLAAVKYRIKTWSPDMIVYEVGADQVFHFRQLFKICDLLGYGNKEMFVHIAHGLIRWPTGKFSTRKGDTIHLEEVLNEVIERAEKLCESAGVAKDLTDEERKTVAKKIGIGAIKYNDLKQNPRTDVIFDWDQILTLQGNSGPYLQYTYARTCSVLAKAELSLRGGTTKQSQTNFGIAMTEEEITLLRTLYRFPEIVAESAKTFSPNILCNFLFDLAQQFNLFYEKERIIGSENEQFRLMLTAAVGQILKNGLNLLGIEALQRM